MKRYFLHSIQPPSRLVREAEAQWAAYMDAAGQAGVDTSWAEDIRQEAIRVWPFSEFIARTCTSTPDILSDLVVTGDLERSYSPDTIASMLSSVTAQVSDDHSLGTVLRALRRREMVRIAWRDLSGKADLQETMRDLSLLADACISVSCSLIHGWLADRYGQPEGTDGTPQQLVVIAMGKLGAQELNFSSDIDLIFAFPEPGQTRGGRESISCEQFFTRLCRRLIAVIGKSQADGMVFRVDTRLRPWGDSGPVCMSFDAMEGYYETQGREWERYAWVKARPVTGHPHARDELLRRLSPFVYRRYLDYSTFDALRDMKAMIEDETRRKGLSDNVKLGPGGIREVEFIAQAFQLLQGGRDSALRTPVLLQVLPTLARRHILPDVVCRELEDAYVFLRNTEHRLQEYQDRQTQLLPSDHDLQERLALSMGFRGWETFRWELGSRMESVHAHFHALFMRSDSAGEKDEAVKVWQAIRSDNLGGTDEGVDPNLIRMLGHMGFEEPVTAVAILSGIHQDRMVSSMLPKGRRRLDSLMPRIIRSAAATSHPVKALGIMASIIQVIARRTVYINMLDENPEAVDHLLKLCLASPWITSFITRRPVVLDELLDPRTLYTPSDRKELERLLAIRFDSIQAHDLEVQMDELRMFKQSAVMRIAAADITGAIPLMRVSDYLTDTAEVIVQKVLELSCEQVADRFFNAEREGGRDSMPDFLPDFLVVGYGKFGGIELGYGSDLDLVFLHHASDIPGQGPVREAGLFYVRVGQRMIHILTTRTPAGILYNADMRLRPGGDSGPLVCTMERFRHYMLHEAWTWEHQALIRARPVAGSHALGENFQEVRRQVLTLERDIYALKGEICAMRERMMLEHGGHGDTRLFDLKHGRGGIVDIEFMVQYLVLLNAHRCPELCQWTDNMRLIDTLESNKIITDEQADTLRTCYLEFRKAVHRLSLQERPAKVPVSQFSHEVDAVRRLWDCLMS